MNRYTRAAAAIAAVLLLGAAALLFAPDAEAGGGGQRCITTYNGKWALVEIGINDTCTGQNDRGSLVGVSDIPSEQAKPAVRTEWRGSSLYHRFYYNENRPSNVWPTTATALSSANEDLRVNQTRSVPKIVRPLRRSDSVNFVGPTSPRETLTVVYRADEDHRTIKQGDRYYREWRDNRGVWQRSGSYGTNDYALQLARWNTYQRSQDEDLYNSDGELHRPDGGISFLPYNDPPSYVEPDA